MCGERERAQHEGTMFYSSKHGMWVFPADDRRPPKILRDRWYAPFGWTFCPFCGGALPDAETIIERLIKPPPREADPGATDGEDGG